MNLDEYPFLHWQWKVEKVIQSGDETTREGDDYAARVYVIVDGGLFFWRTKALNFVWASNKEKGSIWANAFAGQSAIMTALRNNREDSTGVWQTEKVDLRTAFKKHFGGDFNRINAVAIMSDTDNTESVAESCYGDIFFSSE